jgi:hypothetical protein
MTNFDEVIEYVFTTFKNTGIAFDEVRIKGFLGELETSTSIHGQRLLMNIAIDLKHNLVKPENYLSLLLDVQVPINATEQEFDSAVLRLNEKQLLSDTPLNHETDYVTIMNVGSFYELVEDDKSYNIPDNWVSQNFNEGKFESTLNVNFGKGDKKLTWVMPHKKLSEVIRNSTNHVFETVNRLGLPLVFLEGKTDINDPEIKEFGKNFVYVIFPKNSIKSLYQPNATSDGYYNTTSYKGNNKNEFGGLFLSNHTQNDNWGKTFVRDGTSGVGLDERVFHEQTFIDEPLKAFLLGKLDAIPPKNLTTIIQEAYQRLNYV